MKKELKKCPFCGGKAELVEMGIHVWSPRCTQCECKLNQVYRTEQQAIEAWNTRKPIDAILEKLDNLQAGETPEWNDGYYSATFDAIRIVKGGE